MSKSKMPKELEKTKRLFLKLKRDENMVLFSEGNLTNNLIRKLKTLNNKKSNEFVNLVLRLDNRNDVFKVKSVYIPTKTVFVEKKSQISQNIKKYFWFFLCKMTK